ncbi:MAG: hypothetical protein CMK32_15370 [Porticoccaceae bacterium]|nr:hypothetical protein [Porticoccaceae bacterium]
MSQDTVQRLAIDVHSLTGSDKAVYDWLTDHFGAPPVNFWRQMRWRTAWEAEMPVDGQVKPVLVRGSRGEDYESFMTLHQEADIHHVMERHGVPAPRVYGMIENPVAIVMEKIRGGINSELIEDPNQRQRVRREFIEALVKLHSIPPEAFGDVGFFVPRNSRDAAFNMYKGCIDIVRRKLTYPVGYVEFVARWLERKAPADRNRVGFVTGDAGQFMYDDEGLTGLIDFEVSYLGDPAAEFAGMRLRHSTEPLGEISELCDYYESLTGDRISKKVIEYHSAGFAGTNSMLMWPLIFKPEPSHDLLAYLQFTIATSRWGLSGIAEYEGVKLEVQPEPEESPIAFPSVAPHMEQALRAIDTDNAELEYKLVGAADNARYLDRVNRYGASILAADIGDAKTLTGKTVATRLEADQAVYDFVCMAGPESDVALVVHFHRWLSRQNFLLKGCGSQSYLTEYNLQYIPPRPADQA